MGKRMWAALGGVLFAVTMVAGVTPASATSPSYGELTLVVYEGADTSGPIVARTDLSCAPDGGGHPESGAACAALYRADGDPGRLAGRSGTCTMEYAPVTAVARGYWHGGMKPVEFTRTYGNRCAMRQATTPVFDIY